MLKIPYSAGDKLNADDMNLIASGNFDIFTAGESMDSSSKPLALYLKASDGKVYKTINTGDESSFKFIGFLQVGQTLIANDSAIVHISDIAGGFSGLTAGSFYYIDSTAGDITSTRPSTNAVQVAIAVSATDILIHKPESDGVLILVASDNLQQSADTERSTNNDAYTKVKDIEIYQAGTIRVKFDLKSSGGVNPAYGQIYKNGVAVGTERINSTSSYVTYSEDIEVLPEDNIQLYYKDPSGDPGSYAFIRNFRFYFDRTISDFTSVITD